MFTLFKNYCVQQRQGFSQIVNILHANYSPDEIHQQQQQPSTNSGVQNFEKKLRVMKMTNKTLEERVKLLQSEKKRITEDNDVNMKKLEAYKSDNQNLEQQRKDQEKFACEERKKWQKEIDDLKKQLLQLNKENQSLKDKLKQETDDKNLTTTTTENNKMFENFVSQADRFSSQTQTTSNSLISSKRQPHEEKQPTLSPGKTQTTFDISTVQRSQAEELRFNEICDDASLSSSQDKQQPTIETRINKSQLNSEDEQEPTVVISEKQIKEIQRSQSEPLEFGEIRAIFPARLFHELTPTEDAIINLDSILEPISSNQTTLRQLKKQLILGKDVLSIPISYANVLLGSYEVKPRNCRDFKCDVNVDYLDFVNVGIVYQSADPLPRGRNVHEFMDFHRRELKTCIKGYSSIYDLVVVDKMLLGDIVSLAMKCCDITFPQQYRVQVDFTYKNQDVSMILSGHENIPLGQMIVKNVTLVEEDDDGEDDLMSRMDQHRGEMLDLLKSECSQPFATIPQWFASTCLKCLTNDDEDTFTRIGSVPPGIDWPGEVQPVCKRLWDLLNSTFGDSKPPAIIDHENQIKSSSTKATQNKTTPKEPVVTETSPPPPVPSSTKVTIPSSEKQIPTKLRIKFEEFGNYFCSSDEKLKSVKEELLCRGWTGKGREPSVERVMHDQNVVCYDEYSEFELNQLENPTNLTLRLNLKVPKADKPARVPPQTSSSSQIPTNPLQQEEKQAQKENQAPNEQPSTSKKKSERKNTKVTKLDVTMEGIGKETFDSTDELSVVYFRLLTKFDNDTADLPLLHRCISNTNGTRIHENFSDFLDTAIGELDNIHDLVFSVQPECVGETKKPETNPPAEGKTVTNEKLYPEVPILVTLEGIGPASFSPSDELGLVYQQLLDKFDNNSTAAPQLMRVFVSPNGTRIMRNQMNELGTQLGKLKKKEDLVFCLQSDGASIVPVTSHFNYQNQQQVPVEPAKWTEFRSNIMNLILWTTEDKPCKHSMKVKLIDYTNGRSPLCSLMQCLLRTKAIRSLFLKASGLFQSLADCEDCSVVLPNFKWNEPQVRDFLYWFCHVAWAVKLGSADNYVLNDLKNLVINSTLTDQPDTLMLFCTLMNLLDEATTVTLPTSTVISPISTGFNVKRRLTKTCKTCASQSHNEEAIRFVDLEMRRFHLYFIPQQPWSKQTKIFPMKVTLTLSNDMKVADLAQMATEFMPSVAVDQWRPFQAQKKFVEMKVLPLNVTLGTIDEFVTKICFYQFFGNEFSLLRVKKVTEYSSLGNDYLPIPPFIVATPVGEGKFDILMSYLLESDYLNVIKESSLVQNRFILDAWALPDGTGEVRLIISNFDEKKFKTKMWQTVEKGFFKKAWKILQSDSNSSKTKQFVQLFTESDKNSISLNNLLSQHFNAIAISSIENWFDCPTCKMTRQCVVKSTLSTAPGDLVIHLRQQQNEKKINVICPHELDLTTFTNQIVRYKLTGIVTKDVTYSHTEWSERERRPVPCYANVYYAKCLLRSNNTWGKLDHLGSRKIYSVDTDDAVMVFYERSDIKMENPD